MHNFTQSGWLILFIPEHLSGQHKLGKSRQTLFLAEQLRSVPTSTVCSPIADATWTQWGKQSNSWTPWLFFLDQGFPVEYGLDTFNTPHTGTTLRHPQNWLCRLRCSNPLRHLALIHLWATFSGDTHASPRNNQNYKITVTSTFISSNNKHDFCYIRRTYHLLTSNNALK